MEYTEAVRTEDQTMNVVKERGVKPRIVPPPGDGKKIYEIDPMLRTYNNHLDYR